MKQSKSNKENKNNIRRFQAMSVRTEMTKMSFPHHMALRAAPISVSITGHMSAESSQGFSRGLVLWQLPMFAPLLLSFKCREHDKKAAGTIFKVFGMTRPGFEPTTSRSCSGCSNHQASLRTEMRNTLFLLLNLKKNVEILVVETFCLIFCTIFFE